MTLKSFQTSILYLSKIERIILKKYPPLPCYAQHYIYIIKKYLTHIAIVKKFVNLNHLHHQAIVRMILTL